MKRKLRTNEINPNIWTILILCGMLYILMMVSIGFFHQETKKLMIEHDSKIYQKLDKIDHEQIKNIIMNEMSNLPLLLNLLQSHRSGNITIIKSRLVAGQLIVTIDSLLRIIKSCQGKIGYLTKRKSVVGLCDIFQQQFRRLNRSIILSYMNIYIREEIVYDRDHLKRGNHYWWTSEFRENDSITAGDWYAPRKTCLSMFRKELISYRKILQQL